MLDFCKLLPWLCLCVVMGAALALPAQLEPIEARGDLGETFASDASQLIATNLLKFNKDIDANQAYSPLGITSILAVLAEGAAGATYDEFEHVFGNAKEREPLRTSFRRVLSNYRNREYSAPAPSFQTWLYVYRNHSVRPSFRQLIRSNYFVDVRDIDRLEYDWSEPNTAPAPGHQPAATTNSKDVEGFETLKRLPLADTYGEEIVDKEPSKFDRFVDDKQYVEKPAILAEMQQQQKEEKEEEKEQQQKEQQQQEEQAPSSIEPQAMAAEGAPAKEQTKREQEDNIEDNETVREEEKLQATYDSKLEAGPAASDEPEKVSLPLQRLESAVQAAAQEAGEIMLAMESHLSAVRRAFGARSLFRKDDITSVLSANSITGRSPGSQTKMLLFNGLYYRGRWARPFAEQPDSTEFFFTSSEDALRVPFMQATGSYRMAELPRLQAKAICIPYEDPKYTMLLMVPDEVEGLRNLIELLEPADIAYTRHHGVEKELRLSLPKFQAEETSRAEAMLQGLGLQKLFARDEANLSLLSDDPDLHVEEIVQFVNVRVDEAGSSANSLSASSLSGSDGAPTLARATPDQFAVDRPFLYFVLDCEEEFVIASGKITAPELKDDIPPIAIEVEFQQA